MRGPPEDESATCFVVREGRGVRSFDRAAASHNATLDRRTLGACVSDAIRSDFVTLVWNLPPAAISVGAPKTHGDLFMRMKSLVAAMGVAALVACAKDNNGTADSAAMTDSTKAASATPSGPTADTSAK